MYNFESRIRYSETDSTGKLSLEGLLNYFQDCSTFHSEDLGVGIGYLRREKLIWVLSAWQIVAGRYPDTCERVTVGTFPYEFKGCFGYRNFCMMDGEGSCLAKANTLWTLLNTDTMKPAYPTQRMIGQYELEERLEMEYAPRKISVPEGGILAEKLVVRRHHLDTNNHVNNVQYVRMAMDYLPEGFLVGQMRAEYKKQALLGDEMIPYVAKEKEKTIVSMRAADGSIYVNVEFRLREKENGDDQIR